LKFVKRFKQTPFHTVKCSLKSLLAAIGRKIPRLKRSPGTSAWLSGSPEAANPLSAQSLA
jgi:hypothetical protein